MATAVTIPIEEYLHTSYLPDRDYVDGETQERNLGEQWHSAVQINLGHLFLQHRNEWKLRPLTEQRVRVAGDRVRIPDVCVVPASEPFVGVLGKPPLLCIEVLSPEDRWRRVQERVQDMGVGAVWIVNPLSRDIWTVTGGGEPLLHDDSPLTLAGTPVHIPVSQIFALIDEAPPADNTSE